MSDDLVKRLRDWEHVWPEDMNKPEGHLYEEAADRIEELEAKLAKFEAMTMVDFANYLNVKNMTTLAELTGGEDE